MILLWLPSRPAFPRQRREGGHWAGREASLCGGTSLGDWTYPAIPMSVAPYELNLWQKSAVIPEMARAAVHEAQPEAVVDLTRLVRSLRLYLYTPADDGETAKRLRDTAASLGVD